MSYVAISSSARRQPWWAYPLLPLVYWGDARFHWWHLLLLPVSVPIVCIMFTMILLGAMVVGFVSIPWNIRAARREAREEEEFYELMLMRGRLKEWGELVPDISAGLGTVIVEQGDESPARGLPLRVWWTCEAVLSEAPMEPPGLDDLDVFGFYHPDAFVEWCFHRYLDPERGSGILVRGFKLPMDTRYWDTGWAAKFLREKFPSLSVVDTVYYRFPRCLGCGYDLRASAMTCPECGRRVARRGSR